MEGDRWTAPQILPLLSGDYWEADPYPYLDGKFLYFASNKPVEENTARNGSGWRWNIYMAERSGMHWKEPKPLPSPINLEDSHDGHPWLTPNGSFYFCSSREGGLGGLDLYCSKQTEGRFTDPVNLGEAVNSKFGEEYFYLPPDESYIIFTSNNRPDGYGEHDLYISFKRDDGSWKQAKNMGSIVNSNTPDCFPRVSPDGKCLFYVSYKKGNFDIYWMDAKIIDELKSED
jgi:hypothetical protein